MPDPDDTTSPRSGRQRRIDFIRSRQRPPLIAHHREELHRSGIDDATAHAAGLYSTRDPAVIARILHRHVDTVADLGWFLVYPYGPDYSRVKPDRPRPQKNDKPAKYLSPSGMSNRVYFPPHARQRLDDLSMRIIITEGEKKALAADGHGFCAIGLVGVWGWKVGGRDALLPELRELPCRGRDVVIVFDSDVRYNPQSQAAELQLAVHLQRRGASVRIVRLPDGPLAADGKPAKTGLDDYLVAHGRESLDALIAAALPPEEMTAEEERVDARKLDPAETVRQFLELYTVDDVCTIRYWRGDWYIWTDGRDELVPESQVKILYTRHVSQCAWGVTTGMIESHLAQLRAQAAVDGVRMLPAWLMAPDEEWDARDCVTCPSGILHLPSAARGLPCLMPLTPQLFGGVPIAVDYVEDPPEPVRFLQFIGEVFGDDTESITTLQKYSGYILSGRTDLQKMLVIIGPPRSGKSTIGRVFRALLGADAVAGPSLDDLASRFGPSGLLGRKLAIIPDARIGRGASTRAVLERVLAIVGEDLVAVDRKGRDPVQVHLPTRLLILSNELPSLPDPSGALAVRMVIVSLTRSFAGAEDLNLMSQLQSELPGILRWALDGWRMLEEDPHLVEPESSATLRAQLVSSGSPMHAFLEECCEHGPSYRVTLSEFARSYRQWLQEHGHDHLPTDSQIGRDLHAAVAGLRTEQPRMGGHRLRQYVGLRLRSLVGR